ncbi:MAG: hypothetical protein HYR85_08960 [Planctomycetes bacterium]|nr:hypothetical protein [Planctomycetota bacterium]MBI3844750.1 hypothetical protein [Planctomycetota bacterium]
MNAQARCRSVRGSVLVVSLVTGVFIAGFTYAFVLVCGSEIRRTDSDSRNTRALQAAESGISESFDRLNRGLNASIDRHTDARLPYSVTASVLGTSAAGNRVYRLTSHASFAGIDRAVEVDVENQTQRLRTKAAITANGPVALSGSVTVDGRDWDLNGFGVVGPGVNGVTSSQLVTSGGSSSVGGNGLAPIRRATALNGVFQQAVLYGDSLDNDGDGRVDEEALDGIDNDGDGRVDEDLAPFPQSPDALLGLADGTLTQLAQNQGTYFSSASAFSTYLSQNGGEIPGGKIIVMDFPATSASGPVWNPGEFGDAMNADPSIVVFHSAYSNSVVKNLHGRFKGLLVTDYVDHVNGTAEIVGSIVTFGTSQVGNVFGNGNATIKYSSAVLGLLPVIPSYAQCGWREVANN